MSQYPLSCRHLGASFRLKNDHVDVVVVSAADHEPVLMDERLARISVVGRKAGEARLPDPRLLRKCVGEGAGKRMRHGPDEIVNALGGLIPVDLSVLRAPTPAREGLRRILRAPWRGPSLQRRKLPRENPDGSADDLSLHLDRGLVG